MVASGKSGAQAIDDEFIEKNEKLFKFIKPQKDKEARKINKALRKLSKD
jgi:ferrous iron transport protein B